MLTTRPWWKQLSHTARIKVAVHCYSTIFTCNSTRFKLLDVMSQFFSVTVEVLVPVPPATVTVPDVKVLS